MMPTRRRLPAAAMHGQPVSDEPARRQPATVLCSENPVMLRQAGDAGCPVPGLVDWKAVKARPVFRQLIIIPQAASPSNLGTEPDF
jgi:hypothetical protein